MECYNMHCIYGPTDNCSHASMIYQNGIENCPKAITEPCPVSQEEIDQSLNFYLKNGQQEGIILSLYTMWTNLWKRQPKKDVWYRKQH